MKNCFAIAFSLAAITLPATAASAATIVDNITCSTNTFPSSSCNNAATSNSDVVVGPEFLIGVVPVNGSANPLISVDFANGILTLQGLGNVARTFSGTILTFVNNTNQFSSISHTSGLLQNGASITNGVLKIDLRGSSWNAQSTALFAVSSVPEPGTWMLMILGLGAVGFSMRRRQKAQVRFQFA